VKNAYFNAID